MTTTRVCESHVEEATLARSESLSYKDVETFHPYRRPTTHE